MGGHIKIDRKILDWEWYSDINTCRLFIHLLLKANWKDGRFQGTEVPRGSLVTSYNSLAKDTGLSVKNVRTALNHLETTGEVAVNRQATGSQPATIEESKKERRKESNNNIPSAPDDKSPCAGSFLLNDGTSYEITENDVENFQQLYPGIDVRQEIRNITGWCLSNPKNRKTRSGAKRFLNGWLSRSQNSARPEKKTGAKPTGFSNFQQRDYDFDALERELLESQKG